MSGCPSARMSGDTDGLGISLEFFEDCSTRGSSLREGCLIWGMSMLFRFSIVYPWSFEVSSALVMAYYAT